MGNNIIIDYNSTVGHDTNINNFVTIYPGVNISGNVNISECSEIGTGSQILQQKNIGENSFIGAGAVVINDIPSEVTAVGVPAKPVK